MRQVRVKGFKIFSDRHGKMRCYHRKTGHKIDLQKAPLGSAEFFAECETIRAITEAQKAKAPKAGTLGELIKSYIDTEHFQNLAAATRRDYRRCADFLEPIKDTPVHVIDTPLVSGIHDKAAEKIGWRRANMVRTLLSEVFRYNIPKGLIMSNYAKDVIPKRRPRGKTYANRPWSIEEQEVVLSHAKPHVRVALALMMNTGLDPSDALKLRKDQIDGNTIWGVRGKTGEEIAIPISPTLQAALNRIPEHEAETVLGNSRGEAWTYNGFSTVWHRFKTALEKEELIASGLTLKGLRHTVATTLREAGLDERRIADLLGQKTPSMARHYSRSANLADKNRETMATLEKEIERRTKTVKPSAKSVKPDQNEDKA
ncbi:tyrosine-type recombinase/integrase [Phaeobacter inhibens]|uniref:tyrosine-type recombinase/integrase n=1 Tax=Phaeobacter inhibens TaxID=221822 RepID=UPI0021A5FC84|nr:tyrosine-type recombinase/integrase [Phaeobacter inhibens]UWR88062.1 tyrosine-type recombinase/integrase [Phaeobacter inhibens]